MFQFWNISGAPKLCFFHDFQKNYFCHNSNNFADRKLKIGTCNTIQSVDERTAIIDTLKLCTITVKSLIVKYWFFEKELFTN